MTREIGGLPVCISSIGSFGRNRCGLRTEPPEPDPRRAAEAPGSLDSVGLDEAVGGRRVLLLVLRVGARVRRGLGRAQVRAGQDRRQVQDHLLQRRVVGDLGERGAAGLQEQRAEVAVGVLDREQRAGVVVEPGQPPQVAVLGVARVVAEHVHEVVEHREHVGQVRRGRADPCLGQVVAAGCRLRTTGRAAITNGRIWFLTIGALGHGERGQRLVGGRDRALPRAAGSWPPGPSMFANVCTFASVVGRLLAASPAGRRPRG